MEKKETKTGEAALAAAKSKPPKPARQGFEGEMDHLVRGEHSEPFRHPWATLDGKGRQAVAGDSSATPGCW